MTSIGLKAGAPAGPSPSRASPSAAESKARAKKNPVFHLLAGGVAGCMEAFTCHPLDTIKVRLQIRGERHGRMAKLHAQTGQPPPPVNSAGFVRTGITIVQKEGFLSLYKGLGAVVAGIVPKQAIRFTSFEAYKRWLADPKTGKTSTGMIFLAGLGAGTTEAVMVVTPMDVIKIRLQAQKHSMSDPMDIPKYRNAAHCVYVMLKEEGPRSLYKGVALTAIRQATNQAANFTVYQTLKAQLQKAQPEAGEMLPAWQTLGMGFLSGACGPLFNNPIDVIKTRIQKSPGEPGQSAMARVRSITQQILRNEGWQAFWKGITPRVLRVAPGQAITFAVYERVYSFLTGLRATTVSDQRESDD
ncbi:hypothetical protein CXG81DRAFT_13898 [Caulochytrium protostelioides]|uniref:Mitochondrial carrier n=1 Tax=Caulochytrium protostelioides TaxID=1555241 RepID=A0A4P9X498_9FUNG|nr:hypothetical protein CXG81DRAFT_13898 [Caulochytrium protostelioides]|eukprot:RKO99874.1 hypothetical protein CXG81DRAFT_13898 [Caulochytrium protostelioides]